MTEQNHPTDQRIVVGIDGSDGSKAALRWAMTQARLTGASIDAIASWQDPVMLGYAYDWAAVSIDGESIATGMAKVLQDTVDAVHSEGGQPVDIHARVVQGHPAQVLMQAATGARLLVVGTRGHGTFAGLLLGSVSQHCVQHATGPVVVVPQ